MAEQPITARKHYVYALLREDGQTPFYIGIGAGRRWRRHEANLDGRNPHKENTIRKILATGLTEVPKVKLIEGLTRAQAAAIEIDLILLIMRRPHGPLTNLTNGGDGIADIPAESRKRQGRAFANRWRDNRPEMMANLKRAGALAKTPEARAARSESIKENWKTPERRAAAKKPTLSQAQRDSRSRKMKSPEMRAKLDAGNMRDDVRHRRIAAQKAAYSTPDARAKRSAASKKMWAQKRHQNTD